MTRNDKPSLIPVIVKILVPTKKSWEVMDLSFFMGDVILRVALGFFWLTPSSSGPQRQGVTFVSLKKNRRNSASFELLIGLLVFVVRKLWPKNHKLYQTYN